MSPTFENINSCLEIDKKLEWIWENRLSDINLAMQQLDQVMQNATQLSYRQGIVHANIILAQFKVYLAQYKEAIHLVTEALEYLESKEPNVYTIRALNIIGVGMMTTGEFGEALQNYKKGLLLCENVEAKEMQAILLLNIAELYRGILNENEKALPFFIKALEVSKEIASLRTPIIQAALGLCLIRIGRNEEGSVFISEAQEAVELSHEMNIKKGVYQMAAQAFRELHQPDEAIKLATLNLEMLGEAHDLFTKMNMYLIMGQALQERGNSESAIMYGNSILELLQNDNNDAILMNVYKLLAQAYGSIGQAGQKAHFLELAMEKMEKEISSRIDRQTSILTADMKYKTLEKDNEIHRLKNVELKEQAEMLELTAAELQAALDDLVETQAHLVKSEKLAALGKLVAGVAHEINTPLGIGITMVSYLERGVEGVKAQIGTQTLTKEFLELSISESLQAIELLNSSLNKSVEIVNSFKKVAIDQDFYECRAFNVSDYMKDTMVMMQPMLNQFDHKVNIICDENLVINSYPGALYQIISQLVSNAITHGFKNNEKGQIRITIHAEVKKVKIEVEDNGCGILPEEQVKIFEPFYTTNKNRGNIGLGLHSLHNLVTQVLNGKIELKASSQDGTLFEVVFAEGCKSFSL